VACLPPALRIQPPAKTKSQSKKTKQKPAGGNAGLPGTAPPSWPCSARSADPCHWRCLGLSACCHLEPDAHGEGAAWAAAGRRGQLRHLPPPERARPGLAPPSAARFSTCAQEHSKLQGEIETKNKNPMKQNKRRERPLGTRRIGSPFPFEFQYKVFKISSLNS